MIKKQTKDRLLFFLSAIGLVVATLSFFENRIDWLAAICGVFGDGCKETATYTLFSIPVAIWGIVYYLILIGVLLRMKSLALKVIMLGFGVELALIGLMAGQRFFCLFCVLNAAVQVGIFLTALERERGWEIAAICLGAFIVSNVTLDHENKPTSPSGLSCAENPDAIVASVGGKKITCRDAFSQDATRIYKMRHKIYRFQKERLKETIDNMLLELDAENKGMSVEALRNNLLTDNKAALDKERPSRPKRRHSSQHRNDKVIEKHTTALKKTYPVESFLTPPPLPYINVDVGDSPSIGSSEALVTVIEFSDYQCPACRKGHPTVARIRKIYKDKIRWVFKDFPLNRHKSAKRMAAAARCADEQGKFWEYQDLLFSAKGETGPGDLMRFAGKLNLNAKQFEECLSNGNYIRKIEQEKNQAKAAGVSSTPTLVINGRLQIGVPSFDRLKHLIDDALKAASK